jgi:protein phosphatase
VTRITIPDLCLVALVGVSGSGKSTFGRAHFRPTEVLSSDYCRGLVSDDETDLSATGDAFDVLHFVAARRLARRKLVVVDATNVQPEARRPLLQLARDHDVLAVAIVLNLPPEVCHARNRERPDRAFGPHVIRRQSQDLQRSLRSLEREGFRHVFVLNTPEQVAGVEVVREPLWNDRRGETGPFDLIGDLHGCCDELEELLTRLGYAPEAAAWRHPAGRRAVFLGDLVDRGPRVLDTVTLVRGMVEAGTGFCVAGNHDVKLLRWLRGRQVRVSHGLQQSIDEIEALGEDAPERERVASFLESLISHYVFDGGRLVAAHAGLREEYQGRSSGRVREFCLYGETTGETDEFGLPVRCNWAADYRGRATVVYGHTPVPYPEWLNRTLNIDTGCVFGGRLTALRYPELELVSVAARRVYAEPARPFLPAAADPLTAQQRQDELLDLSDVLGKRIIETRLARQVMIREENATAALEVMSRFAANPKWLVYLPPTMSPPETSARPGLLEHPDEAFGYYRRQGVPRVVCQEKHMGSRAVLIVCRDEETALRRFGVAGEGLGVCLTRTGRRFFDDPALEQGLVAEVGAAAGRAGLWDELATDWLVLDCELMPWSAKAQGLLTGQYAPVGAAARASLGAVAAALATAEARGVPLDGLPERFEDRRARAEAYVAAYRRYCWPVRGLADLKLAPFHLLAGEGGVYADRDHVWHMETLHRLAEHSPLLAATPYRVVDLPDETAVAEAVAWWEALTAAGGEGMVVKPLDFCRPGADGLPQPAVKCRGREYLRIIYGPEYDTPESLERLRSRSVGRKRALALREFALGIEALERFHRREPLRRVHECVFGVLALESEPVDPRL